MPGTYKVGHTLGTLSARAAELHTTGVPTPFVPEYAIRTNKCADVERLAHTKLKPHRIAKRREFFTAELTHIVSVLEKAAAELKCAIDERHDQAELRRRAAEAAREAERLEELQRRERERLASIDATAEAAVIAARAPLLAHGRNAVRLIAASIAVAAAASSVAAWHWLGFRWGAALIGGLVAWMLGANLDRLHRAVLAKSPKHQRLAREVSAAVAEIEAIRQAKKERRPLVSVQTCEGCRTRLRLPIGRTGKVTCPRCKTTGVYSTL
jgi:hypothetical protein